MHKGPVKNKGTKAIDSVGTFRTCLRIYVLLFLDLLGDKQSLIWGILITAK